MNKNGNYDKDDQKEWQEGVAHSIKKQKEQPCLLDRAFQEEQKKPAHLRNIGFLISCPCPKCNPGKM